MILNNFSQQPTEVLDYDLDYEAWLGTDTISGEVVTVTPSGLVVNPVVSSPIIKLWVQGGTDATNYRVDITVLTAAGRTKKDTLRFRIKEFH